MMKNARLKIAACSALALVVASSTGLTSFDLLALDQAQAMAKRPSPRPAPAPPPGGPMHPLITQLYNETANRNVPAAQQKNYWAHRGLFNASAAGATETLTALPENSYVSVYRADTYGVPAVEIDVRLSSDGVPIVAHDFVTARSTGLDGFNGKYNPQWAMQMQQPLAGGMKISDYTATDLTWYRLKSYDPGSKMTLTNFKVQSLAQLLTDLDLGKARPLIVLDLQDSATVAAAAAVVRAANMQNRVVFKFFAASAVPPMSTGGDTFKGASDQIKIWGNDLWYIIQFNDSQISGSTSSNPGRIINKDQYVDPIQWADSFRATGRLIGIGISRPSIVDSAVLTALIRLNQHYDTVAPMPQIGILINPDNSWVVPGQSCTFYRFSAKANANQNVTTTAFSYTDPGEQDRRNFALTQDYIIADLIPGKFNFQGKPYYGYSAGFADYNSSFCDPSLNSPIIADPNQ